MSSRFLRCDQKVRLINFVSENPAGKTTLTQVRGNRGMNVAKVSPSTSATCDWRRLCGIGGVLITSNSKASATKRLNLQQMGINLEQPNELEIWQNVAINRVM